LARSITITVRGKPSYEKWTVLQWLESVKDILETRHSVEVEIRVEDSGEEYPVLVVGGRVFEAYPFEEGFLLEMLDSAIGRILEGEGGSGAGD